MQSHQYSNSSLKDASEVLKSCGVGGYELLLKQHYSLPPLQVLLKKYPTEANSSEFMEENDIEIPVAHLNENDSQQASQNGSKFLFDCDFNLK